MKRILLAAVFAGVYLTVTGCAPALMGAGAAGAYRVGTDERTVGGMWSDTTINTKVKSALIQAPGVDGWSIDVDTLERRVTLTGNVDSEQEARRATDVAKKVAGVKSVKNLLEVGSKSLGESVDDTVLGTRIKGRLAGEKGIKSLNIDVDVNKGVVVLSGIVEKSAQRDRIVEIVRQTQGTMDVVDNLTVRKP